MGLLGELKLVVLTVLFTTIMIMIALEYEGRLWHRKILYNVGDNHSETRVVQLTFR